MNQTPLAGFPAIFTEDTKECHGDPWKEKLAEVVAAIEKGAIVVLCGISGTGKSRMAYEAAKLANLPKLTPLRVKSGDFTNDESRKAIYTTAMMLFIRLRDSFRRDSKTSELKIMTDLGDAALLVIDELQERGETAFEDQKLTAIVDLRYQSGRPTILISNMSKEAFKKSVSPSILSRIQENGGFVSCDWKSYRGQK